MFFNLVDYQETKNSWEYKVAFVAELPGVLDINFIRWVQNPTGIFLFIVIFGMNNS